MDRFASARILKIWLKMTTVIFVLGFSNFAKAGDVPVEFIDRPEDVPARTLRVTLDGVVPGDVTELEVMAADGKWAEPYKLITEDSSFRFRVQPGKYTLRTHRAHSSLAWGDPVEFEVPFKEPKRIFPDRDKIEAKGNLSEKLRFEWFQIPNTAAYRVKIYKKSGLGKTLIRHIVTKQTWLSANLEAGEKYFWTLKPMASLDEPDSDKDAKDYSFTVLKPHRELFPIEIAVVPKPHAVNYQFELVQIHDDETTSDPTTYENKDSIFRAELAPSEYELRVRSVFSNGEISAWSAPRGFFVRLPKPKLTYPPPALRIVSNDEDQADVLLEWKPVEGASRYRVSVYNGKHEEIITKEVPETRLTIKVPHNDTYTWTAAPMLKREHDRSPAAEAPPSSFTMTEYYHLKLGEAEEPSQFYSWARGIYANTLYSAANYDSHSFINQPVYLTTGELAVGYWHRLSNVGVLLSGSASGIDIAGVQNITYNYSGSLGYRWKLEGEKRARAWLGYSHRQTPEVVIDGLLKQVSIKTIGNTGPQLWGTYSDSIGKNWGYQVFGGMYYGLWAKETPNDLPQKNYFTYFASAYLTHRFGPLVQGLLGYTFQVDEAGYQSNDRTGALNHVSYSGHYISLAVIMGLQEAKK